MKVLARNIQPGDIVRGIGLLATDVEPLNDFQTRVYGTTSKRNPDWDGVTESEQFATTAGLIDVDNDHLVNVRRSDAAFRNDRLSLVAEAREEYAASGDPEEGEPSPVEVLAWRLFRIGCMPKGRRYHLTPESVLAYVTERLEGGYWEAGAEAILDEIDALDVPDPDQPEQPLGIGHVLALVVTE